MDWLVRKGFGPPHFAARVCILYVLLNVSSHEQAAAVRAEEDPKKRKVNLLFLETLPLPPKQLSKVREITSLVRQQDSNKILEHLGKGISRSLESAQRPGKFDPLLNFAVDGNSGNLAVRGDYAELKPDASVELRYTVDFVLGQQNSPALNNPAFILVRSGILEIGVKSKVDVETSLMADVDFKRRTFTVPVNAYASGSLTGYLFGLPIARGTFSGSYESDMSVANETRMTMRSHSFFMAGASLFGAGFFSSWGPDDAETDFSIYASPFSASARIELQRELFSNVRAYSRETLSQDRNVLGFGVRLGLWKSATLEVGPQFIRGNDERDNLFMVTLRSAF